jgi:hypothetical protein
VTREYYLTETELEHLRDGGGVRVEYDDGVEIVIHGPTGE